MTPFALTGAGLGLGLGAVYMAAGLHHAAAAHADAARRQEALTVAFATSAPADTYDLIDPNQPPAVAVVERAKAADIKTSDVDCLTAAVYFEARGETARGQAAVAQVVLNRVLHPAFPKTVCAVVYQGAGRRSCQFSFACDGRADVSRESAAWRRARQVALHALAGGEDREIGAATHFHASGVAPAWGPHMLRVAQIGLHVFYRLAPGGAGKAKPAPVVKTPEVMLASAVMAPEQAKLAVLTAVPSDADEAVAHASTTPAAEAGRPEAAGPEAVRSPKPAPTAAAPAAADQTPG